MKAKLLLVALSAIALSAKADVIGDALANSKTWTWAPTTINGGAVWGNAGYNAGLQTDASNIEGAWWGCGPVGGDCPDTFAAQLASYGLYEIPADAYKDAYMVMGSDGTLSKYAADGSLISSGSYAIEGWAEGNVINNNSVRGYLNTTPGAILWPFQINGGGYQPSQFEITYLSSESMILVYAPVGGGAWSESTWWSFKSTDGVPISINNSTVNIDGVYYVYDKDLDAAVVKRSDPDIVSADIKPEVEIEGTVYPVLYIMDHAFANCTSLKEVNIPEPVKAIGPYAFDCCHSLESVKLPSTLEEIGKGAFVWCEQISSMELPASLVSIDDEGLCGCHKLAIEALPENLETLGIYALEGCIINKLQIPDKLMIEPRAFLFSSIKEFVVNDSNPNYKAIDGNIYTKSGDTLVRMALFVPEGVTFNPPASCTALGDYSMYGCYFADNTLRIPDQITSLGEGAFVHLSVKDLVLGDNVKSMGAYLLDKSTVENVTLPANMPENIGKFIFINSMVKHVEIPDAWPMIPPQFTCSDLYLESITYGDNVESIGDNSLASLPSLKEFTLKPSVKNAGYEFLSYVGVEGAYNVPEGVEYFGNGDMMSTAFSLAPFITEITMPSTLKKPVSILTAFRFFGWQSIYGYPFTDGYDERAIAIRKVVNLSSVPLGISSDINLYEGALPDNTPGCANINYYCLPGVGRYTQVWNDPEASRTMDGCIEILSFSNVSINDGVCSFTIDCGSDDFEISRVTYEGNVIEPVNQSRGGSLTYCIEGIGATDLCKVSVEFKYAEYEVEAPIQLAADGSAVTGIKDAFFTSNDCVKVTSVDGALYAHNAISGLTVRVYDSVGREVARSYTSGISSQMIASGLMPGVYLVKVGTSTSKVLVR